MISDIYYVCITIYYVKIMKDEGCGPSDSFSADVEWRGGHRGIGHVGAAHEAWRRMRRRRGDRRRRLHRCHWLWQVATALGCGRAVWQWASRRRTTLPKQGVVGKACEKQQQRQQEAHHDPGPYAWPFLHWHSEGSRGWQCSRVVDIRYGPVGAEVMDIPELLLNSIKKLFGFLKIYQEVY